MNNRPVEQALATLLPTHANELPPELLSLALSLVAQSRSYSTSLKPEEEIARPYACAEIACKRLARTLKLPPLLGHPPCPPRVYKKLYAFLDRSLTQSTVPTRRSGAGSLPGTPTRGASAATSPTKGLASASARTPSKTPRTLQDTPTKSTSVKRTHDGAPTTPSRSAVRAAAAAAAAGPRGISQSSTIIKDAPSWVMPSIRTVCKTLATPAPRMSTWSRPPISRTLPPHIFAGVSSILHFVSSTDDDGNNNELDEEATEFLEPILTTWDKENDEEFKELVSALIVAVYFIVLARRRNPSRTSSGDADVESSSSPSGNHNATANGDANTKMMDKKTFAEMRQTALTSLGLSSSEKKHREDVDRWIAIIMDQGWATGNEWFENVPVGGEDDEAGRDAAEGDDDEEDVSGGSAVGSKRRKGLMRGRDLLLKEDASSHGGLLPGLGTMMQDRVDWLSEDRREDYLEWKDDIMKRVERMEKAGEVVG
ncbi:hypothetical protein VTN02DRAFT_5152 [Thermoascus thermophilus]